MKPFVDRLQVENFACIKSVDIVLTRLHAFIGPNDSGKSSLLRALSFGINAHRPASFPVLPPPPMVPNGLRIKLTWADGPAPPKPCSQLVHLEPDALRAPSALIPKGNAITFQNIRGLGLAGVLDGMLTKDSARFVALSAEFTRAFPGVLHLGLQNSSDNRKVIGATLPDGHEIGPEELSEGMLYWLAFKALMYAQKPDVLLVEEPENGLHPARIAEVVTLLREISNETQVLLATHSPLVINEMKSDEVTIITRTAERGTIATPMRKTKHFEQRSSIYALGELWLSYADGELERDLMPDDNKDTKAAG